MTQKMKCRVCDKDYEPCRNACVQDGVFRWREVACSPECGAIYLQMVMEARGLAPKKTSRSRRNKPVEVDIDHKIDADSENSVEA